MLNASLTTRELGPDHLIGVKLPFATDSELRRLGATTGEAQPVGVRLPSATSLYINSSLVQGNFDKTNMLITNQLVGQGSNYPGTLISDGASKITVTRFSPFMNSPNVNPRNQVLHLIYDDGAENIFVTVPTGWYLTPLELMEAVVNAINDALDDPGRFTLIMSDASAVPGVLDGSPLIYGELTDTLGAATFRFDQDCVGYRNGASLWNCPVGPLALHQTFGPIGMIYTRTLDVVSRELTRYAKRMNSTINPKVSPHLLFRMTLGGGTIFTPNPYNIPAGEVSITGFGDALQLDAFAWDSSQVVTSIDIAVLDQYGELLYVAPPPTNGAEQGGFNYHLHIFIQ